MFRLLVTIKHYINKDKKVIDSHNLNPENVRIHKSYRKHSCIHA